MTYHDAIVDHVLQLLLLPVPVTALGPVGEELDVETLGEAEGECVSVELLGSDPDDNLLYASPVEWDTTIAITCVSRGDQRTAGGRASRALHSLVHTRLMADPSLGDRVSYLSPPRLQFESRVLGTRMGAVTATYTVKHRTPFNTLEA